MDHQEKWVAPDWMTPYLPHIQIAGKYTVEELMNDFSNTRSDNPAKDLRIISVRAQIKLLYALHTVGLV